MSISKDNNYTAEVTMDMRDKLAALAPIILVLAVAEQARRAAESCTYTQREYAMLTQFLDSVTVKVTGNRLDLMYPASARTAVRLDAWASSLLERGLQIAEGTPVEIHYTVGRIDHQYSGCTSYTV